MAAEDPEAGYKPQTGVIESYNEPHIPGLRIDSGIQEGSAISHHYDSLLAKVIGSGADRLSAIRTLRRGLGGLSVVGVGTNTGFLCDLLDAPDFRSATHNTATLEYFFPGGWSAAAPEPRHKAEAVLAMLLHREQWMQAQAQGPWQSLGGWRITESSGRRGAALFYLDDAELRIAGRAGCYCIEIPGNGHIDIVSASLDEDRLVYESEGLRYAIRVHIADHRVTLHTAQGRFVIDVLSGRQAMANEKSAAAGEGNQVLAPMPGLVADVLVKPGDQVVRGESVIVLEAMKLLQNLLAPCDGTVVETGYEPGETVEAGTILVRIESLGASI